MPTVPAFVATQLYAFSLFKYEQKMLEPLQQRLPTDVEATWRNRRVLVTEIRAMTAYLAVAGFRSTVGGASGIGATEKMISDHLAELARRLYSTMQSLQHEISALRTLPGAALTTPEMDEHHSWLEMLCDKARSLSRDILLSLRRPVPRASAPVTWEWEAAAVPS